MFIYTGNGRSRKGDARSSAAARSGPDYTPEIGESLWGAEAQNGDIVEYPLSDASKAQHQDDRLRGNNWLLIHSAEDLNFHSAVVPCSQVLYIAYPAEQNICLLRFLLCRLCFQAYQP